MINKIINILEAEGYPAMLQGSLPDAAEYPDHFFTFWNFETPEDGFYDNAATRAVYGYWITFYSIDPVLKKTESDRLIKTLKANGFILDGRGEDALSDVDTHTGRRLTVYAIEELEEE